MAEASISVAHDQFSCPVCLDLLKDPVTIPCGHSFCMVCINGCWDQEVQRGVYSCPQCRETFTPRPVLHRNNVMAEVVEKLKGTELRAAPPAPRYAGPGDVECDFCTGRKLKAIKSCLTCLASFCETHLKPHYEVPALKKHKLVEASSQLQEKICSQHDEVIKIYCRTDRSFICYLCTMAEHKGHDTVPAKTERTEKQNQLKEVQSKLQQRIQENQKKQQELKQAVHTIKRCAQSAVEDSERIFTELIRSIEKKRSEVTELIRAQEKAELSGAEELLEKLEQEMADLKRRRTELEQLSHTEDHIHFLQVPITDLQRNLFLIKLLKLLPPEADEDHRKYSCLESQSFQSLCVSSGSEDSPSITVHHPLSFDGVRRSVSELKERLEEFCREEFSKIPPHGKRSCPAVELSVLLWIHRLQQFRLYPQNQKPEKIFYSVYYCPLTLDPNTAHPNLRLSEKNRVVTWSNTVQRYSDHPERFDGWEQVMCKESTFRKMAEASISVAHDQFSCPVCLDLLKDPVTIPCGHSFCMVCINGCWDQEDQRGVYSCPQCRETFTPRPVLRRNTMLAEVVEKLKETELQAAPPAPRYAGPGDVECDFCTGRKLKAIKSCLTCLASFCETHLKPHYEVPGLKKHKLVEASSQLQEKICSEHDRLIEIYCRTDRSFICYLCTMAEHKGHDTVPAKTERTEKQNQLKEVQSKLQQRIQENQKKQQELKQAVHTIKRCAQSAVEDSERIFTELIRSIEKKRSEVTELIRAQEKAELSGAEELLEKLEQEMADLKRRRTELEQLSHTEDHIHFLQVPITDLQRNLFLIKLLKLLPPEADEDHRKYSCLESQSFQSLCVSSGSEDSPSITVHHPLSFDGVRRSVSELKERLEEFCREEFSKIPPHGKRSCPAVELSVLLWIHRVNIVCSSSDFILRTKNQRRFST
ncbi:hypothetical protein NFI96_030752, partial [Prochilodus magdalenae]